MVKKSEVNDVCIKIMLGFKQRKNVFLDVKAMDSLYCWPPVELTGLAVKTVYVSTASNQTESYDK